MLKQLLTGGLALLSLQIIAAPSIHSLYHSPLMHQKSDIAARIDAISAEFIGKPYRLGALGEGKSGYYDQNPLYRTDAFDCETYVDTVLALAMANSPAAFEQYIRHIRYQNGKVSFTHRNHFTCLDWNQNNQKQGLIKDITPDFHDKHGHPVMKTATAYIDKPGWYQHFSVDIIRIPHASMHEREQRLARLKAKGSRLPRTLSKITYIPLTVLFDKNGQANEEIFNQIPDAAIVEIVRPDWDLTQQIGTHLNVSHLGFAIRQHGVLLFRSATSTHHCVKDIPLIDYLRETLNSPTIRGISVYLPRSLKNR